MTAAPPTDVVVGLLRVTAAPPTDVVVGLLIAAVGLAVLLGVIVMIVRHGRRR